MKLTIGQKLFFGYLAMALLTVTASAYAIYGLYRLNDLAHVIIDKEIFVQDITKKMIDTLIAQENAEKKYLILKDSSIEEIFRTRSLEFKSHLDSLSKSNNERLEHTLSILAGLHKQYDDLFNELVVLIKEKKGENALTLSEGDGRKLVDDIATHLRDIYKNTEKVIDEKMNSMRTRGIKASRMTMIISVLSLIAGVTLALLITYDISKPIKELKKATGLIAEGQFDYDIKVKRHDEIGSLADAFEIMTERLKILEKLNLDASPLTGLPGNLAIEKEIEQRLNERMPFSLCQVDLDNFKPFADKYGYAWGSEVIKEVAVMLTEDLQLSEDKDVFIGHIGGDDFVIISNPSRAEQLCKQMIETFDRRILKFYSEKDRQRGFIIGKNRQGLQQNFPLMSITIAVVTDDGSRFKNPLDMAQKAAELKERAKTLPGSNYVKMEDMDKTS